MPFSLAKILFLIAHKKIEKEHVSTKRDSLRKEIPNAGQGRNSEKNSYSRVRDTLETRMMLVNR